jgi:lysophospholipase L1-like esterase
MLLGLAVAEIVLRSTLTIEDLFGRLITHPELASEGWARSFVRDYGELRRRAELGADLGGYVHDPLLGWDVPGRIRRDEPSSPVLDDGRRRIAVLGDSFTYGSQVATEESFPAQLEDVLGDGTMVLNMGVRAYGVGQAALKFWLYGRHYDPDVVVLAIFGPDVYRTPLDFYRFAKPRFVPGDGDDVAIVDVPVPTPEEAYEKLTRELPPLWYGYALARQAFLTSRAWQELTHHDELFFHVYDGVHEALVRRTAEMACEIGARIVLVYVPQAEEFEHPSRTPSRERARLTRIFERAGVEHVDLARAFLARYRREAVYDWFYVWDEGLAGHFSPTGNRVVAEVLAEVIASEPRGVRCACRAELRASRRHELFVLAGSAGR